MEEAKEKSEVRKKEIPSIVEKCLVVSKLECYFFECESKSSLYVPKIERNWKKYYCYI